MRAGEAVLRVENLSKDYSGIEALDRVSFQVSSGELVGVIGPNGSGKTTLIDCISGFAQPRAGQVSFLGEDITQNPPHKIARRGLVRTFQLTKTYGSLSALEHLLLAGQEFQPLGWWDSLWNSRPAVEMEAKARVRAAKLLDLLGIAAYSEVPASSLSYGQRKLLALGMSLMSKPPILLLDEPVAGVNERLIERIRATFLELNAEGQTLFIVEHNIEFIAGLCRRVIVLNAGRILADGPPNIIWDNSDVFRAYIGDSLYADRDRRRFR